VTETGAGSARLAIRKLRERLRERPRRPTGRSASSKADLGRAELGRLHEQMRDCLLARGGEVSARARAADLGRAYLRLSDTGRQRFLTVLATEFGVDHAAAAAVARRLLDAEDNPARARVERELRATLVPTRVLLLRQFNALPQGTKFLVDLRADLLRFARSDEALVPLEQDLKGLLSSWFDIGFLELRRITWDSPASLLEKLARSEAVHAVTSWDDLKDRLDTDRRLLAFFHPQMPDEPLIFVEVALVRGLPSEIAPLLDQHAPRADPQRADTAVFYSISNTQPGLVGISFGSFLIKQVIDELRREFRRVRTFATLSPIPGFRLWLTEALAQRRETLLTPGEHNALETATGAHGNEAILAELLDREDWHLRPAIAAALRAPLLRLCAAYLLSARRDDGGSLDPVANFHLSNGARVERLNWLADPSPKSMRESAGMMVNYLYSLAHIEPNHEAYAGEGVVVASGSVQRLAREGGPR
jgi:malonyl-CoA decarboxylase